MKIAILVGYAGNGFSGSQYQPNKRTVEGDFIKAGISCNLWQDAESSGLRTAGRTDKGVSVRHQLFSVTITNPDRFKEAINFHLPPDIWCLGYSPVPDDFYPRYAVSSRTYRYYFPYPLNIESMKKTAEIFIGTHNFSGFSKIEPGKNPVRTVLAANVFEENGLPIFEVTAKSFLWNMVRGMAGFLFAVGLNLMEADRAIEQLNNPLWRVHPAPANGLILWDFDADITYLPVKSRKKTDRDLFSTALSARLSALTSEALLQTDSRKLLIETGKRKYGTLFEK